MKPSKYHIYLRSNHNFSLLGNQYRFVLTHQSIIINHYHHSSLSDMSFCDAVCVLSYFKDNYPAVDTLEYV